MTTAAPPAKPIPEQHLLTEDEAANLLRVKPNTLATWRMSGRYNLPFVRVGRAIRYRAADVTAWVDSRCSPGTTKKTAG
ncbi:helix-turn-helix domain-containing protein [Limnoglobus roseus]|uniref:Helix-turn-helix domain-containing protein n=1 Tax=Limnoglobus roseus TaxID=2598579 RepID=A0A5C1A8W9_9BACT|nr:helix-turn-helix domain-containing protein [Limnoglobus roseus]QEL14653.1 hypothetical protein PX52LOC_01546 [Limnoglobus roseus]